MINDSIAEILERDLNRLKQEVLSYKEEENLWLVKNEISNSAGNLCLHLLGNMNHFIGNVLGGTGYIREREKEFSLKNVSRKEIVSGIEKLSETVKDAIGRLNKDDFEKIYPINVFQKEMTTEFFIIHLTTHLNYHLGQINYHRRLLDK